jgi:hypothetical protein
MKIRVERFCSLATARDWQTWLFNYDKELYADFINKLRQARGCGDNRRLMHEVLAAIDMNGNGVELGDFLRSHYPYMISEDDINRVLPSDESELDRLFGIGVLTYPKRKIIFGSKKRLMATVRQFVSDKTNYEFMIADGKAYVEYLDKGEEHLADKIPAGNWLLRNKTNGKT